MSRVVLSRRAVLALLLSLPMLIGGCGSEVMGPDGEEPGPDPGSYDHGRSAGASANDLLSSGTYDRLVVQIQYMEGFEPTAGGLQILEEFITARLNKPSGIDIQVAASAIPATSQATYSAGDVRSLEAEHRTAFTDGSTLAVYLLYLDGEYSEASNVLGIAYNNTSMALFAEKIRQFSGGALQPSVATVEGTVANHEFGHIVGLVNNGSDMQTEHQDEEHGRHCDNPDCLMYYAVRTTDFIDNLLEGMPELDQNCLDDLVANGGA